jgi:hypothetical protein
MGEVYFIETPCKLQPWHPTRITSLTTVVAMTAREQRAAIWPKFEALKLTELLY